jgi:hypothetical protein
MVNSEIMGLLALRRGKAGFLFGKVICGSICKDRIEILRCTRCKA